MKLSKQQINIAKKALLEAVALLGGQHATARYFKVSQPAVWDWLNRGVCPPDKALKFEIATKGKVKCCHLRPDLYCES